MKIAVDKKKRKIKNSVLRLSTYLSGTLFVISASEIDRKSIIPFLVCCITLIYLFLFGSVNNWFTEEIPDNKGSER